MGKDNPKYYRKDFGVAVADKRDKAWQLIQRIMKKITEAGK